MAKLSVFIRIMENIVYSNTGDVTNAHSLYWIGFLGIYRRIGFALRANSMQFLWKRNIHFIEVIKEWFDRRNDYSYVPYLARVTYLIFVKFTIFVRRFSFILKCYNDKTNKYINHEEGNDDDVNEIKTGYNRSIIMYRAHILLIRVYRHIQNTETKKGI